VRVVILGAAGRDFHNFNVVYRDDPAAEVIAFTAAQIPGIAGRRYPPALAGRLYPDGIPIIAEAEMGALVRSRGVDQVVFAYSDVPHAYVMRVASSGIRGVEGVTDKDLAAALLARELKADALLMLTDVEAVYLDWGAPGARAIAETTPRELRRHAFAPGSMGPKVEAACRFVETTRGCAGIGRLEDAAGILAGRRGTIVRSA